MLSSISPLCIILRSCVCFSVPLTGLIVLRDVSLISGGFYIRYRSLHPPVSGNSCLLMSPVLVKQHQAVELCSQIYQLSHSQYIMILYLLYIWERERNFILFYRLKTCMHTCIYVSLGAWTHTHSHLLSVSVSVCLFVSPSLYLSLCKYASLEQFILLLLCICIKLHFFISSSNQSSFELSWSVSFV